MGDRDVDESYLASTRSARYRTDTTGDQPNDTVGTG